MKAWDYVQCGVCVCVAAIMTLMLAGALLEYNYIRHHGHHGHHIETELTHTHALFGTEFVRTNGTMGELATALLEGPRGADVPVNLIVVGGPERTGKSTLANLMVGQPNAFAASTHLPTGSWSTIYPDLWQWSEFRRAYREARNNNGAAVVLRSVDPPACGHTHHRRPGCAQLASLRDNLHSKLHSKLYQSSPHSPEPSIGVVDMPGSATRTLSIPVALAQMALGKVGVYLVPEERDRVLNTMYAFVRAGALLPGLREELGHPMYGHIHLLVRSMYQTGNAEAKRSEISDYFLEDEPEVGSDAAQAAERNEKRRIVRSEFASIHVHFAPPAVRKAAFVDGVAPTPLQHHHYRAEYLHWFHELMKDIVAQVSVPRRIRRGEILTGSMITTYFHRLVTEYTELFDGGTLVIHDAMNLVVDHAVRDVLLNLTTTAEQSDLATFFDATCPDLGSWASLATFHAAASTCPAWLNDVRQRLDNDARAAFEARLVTAFNIPPLRMERQRFMDVFEEDLEMGLDMAMGLLARDANEVAEEERQRWWAHQGRARSALPPIPHVRYPHLQHRSNRPRYKSSSFDAEQLTTAGDGDKSPASALRDVLVLKSALASCQKETEALVGTLAARDRQNKQLQKQLADLRDEINRLFVLEARWGTPAQQKAQGTDARADEQDPRSFVARLLDL